MISITSSIPKLPAFALNKPVLTFIIKNQNTEMFKSKKKKKKYSIALKLVLQFTR